VRAGPPDLRGVQKDKAQRVQRDADGLSDVGHVRLSVTHVRTNAATQSRAPRLDMVAETAKKLAEVGASGYAAPFSSSRFGASRTHGDLQRSAFSACLTKPRLACSKFTGTRRGSFGMQYEDGTTWRPPSAPEQPDFGTTAVPDHPGYLMPSPGVLWQAFEVALGSLSIVEVENRAAQAMLPCLSRRSTKQD
jgi:hypothetical protein